MFNIESLNAICPGWTESCPTGVLCNRNAEGGIIDSTLVTGSWFVIFNDGRLALDGLETREAAIEAFCNAARDRAVPQVIRHSSGSAGNDYLVNFAGGRGLFFLGSKDEAIEFVNFAQAREVAWFVFADSDPGQYFIEPITTTPTKS